MMKVVSPKFTVVTRRNVKKIAEEMKVERGLILIADAKYYTIPAHLMDDEFKMTLCARFHIEEEGRLICYSSEADKFTIGTEEREYRLSKKRQPTSDRLWDSLAEWFQRLQLDNNYELNISALHLLSRGLLYKHSVVLYIPRPMSDNAAKAFTYALKWMLDKWNVQKGKVVFTDVHIEKMVTYIMEDLKSGAVMKHNLQAGMDADVAVGLA
jgi:hypothetical protein